MKAIEQSRNLPEKIIQQQSENNFSATFGEQEAQKNYVNPEL
jgi:hypothetical protein